MRRKRVTRGIAGMGNDAFAHAMREIGRSSATCTHQDRRTRRGRARQAKLLQALRFDLESA